ncbi:hypothetical protein QC763_401225 [Podospora pseudopauciseta]|uniref:Uncharacterized protein n=1 Tax=Podospora pseudopauciseta TaxID=2093780 RepID=A0ABR0HBC5_9PEZI|nr:hypothetical protein QC763_401225 [Podospora pseudopauciseta]
MKSRLINAMANIYRQAKQVVIVDALALRLWSNDPANPGVVLGFGNIVVGCTKREAGDISNNARALFPVIGLEWEHGLSIDDGMRKIYEARRHEAVKMVL